MNAIAVTGLGLLCPGYDDPERLFQALYRGRSLLARNALGGVEDVSTVSSVVDHDQMQTLEAIDPGLKSPTLSKAAKMGAYAADKAINHAGLENALRKGDCRAGLFVGCNKNFLKPEHIMTLWRATRGEDANPQVLKSALADIETLRPHQATETIAGRYAFDGPVVTYGDACAAGATAIVSGYRRLLAGELEVAVVGAAEHATQAIFQLLFAKLGALYRAEHLEPGSASRPFDKHQGGCLLADGSAFLVLETLEHFARVM